MCKKYIEVDGLRFYYDFKLLPSSFYAITLFGRIYTNVSKEELEEDLKTSWGKKMVNHERIHTLQAKSFKTKYLAFYILYIWYWFIGLFKFGVKYNASYYKIPFEQEAYENEGDFSYNKTKWKQYK